MIVRCTLLRNPITGEQEERSHWLSVGRNYVVLAIDASFGEGIYYRMIGDDLGGGPGLYDSRQFEVVDSAIPTMWIVRGTPDGSVEFGPPEWVEPGFWEAYFDGEATAREQFASRSAEIMRAAASG